MSWRCTKCNHVNRDNDAAICANCGKPNPNRVGSNPFTPEHSSFGRVACPHCGYSSASGRDKTCYPAGEKLRPGKWRNRNSAIRGGSARRAKQMMLRPSRVPRMGRNNWVPHTVAVDLAFPAVL
jgi:DNA-directed RNA polymerase subunit RPC12/RpoP